MIFYSLDVKLDLKQCRSASNPLIKHLTSIRSVMHVTHRQNCYAKNRSHSASSLTACIRSCSSAPELLEVQRYALSLSVPILTTIFRHRDRRSVTPRFQRHSFIIHAQFIVHSKVSITKNSPMETKTIAR